MWSPATCFEQRCCADHSNCNSRPLPTVERRWRRPAGVHSWPSSACHQGVGICCHAKPPSTAGQPLAPLPDAYSTVWSVCRSSIASTERTGSAAKTPASSLLPWTASDSLEALDLDAIRRAEQARLTRHAAARSELPPLPTVITRLPEHLQPDVLSNALLLLDKPVDWESEEVTRCLRWALKGQHLGYVGGLEQGATGLMLLMFGKATALTGMLQGLGARYTGSIQLGVETDTHDAAGRVTGTGAWQLVTDAEIQDVAQRLVGRQVQVPPVITPVKVRGRPVHELARRLPESELTPRPVTVSALRLERETPGSSILRLDVTFSSAGYVRSLVAELGHLLGCGAHLTAWRRESVGGFSVDNAWTLEVLLPVARQLKRDRRKRGGR